MDRNSEGMKSGIVGIVCNTVLFLLKLIIGILSGSVSIIADAINNLSDSVSSILTFVGYYLSSKPADREHPYGHERFEYISGFLISFIMMILSFEIITNSINSIRSESGVEMSFGLFIALAFSILLKGWMFFYYRGKARSMDSDVLWANAADSRNDVLITSGILVGVLVNYFFDIKIDGYVGLGVAAIIIVSAIRMLRGFISELLGERPDESVIDSIVLVLKNTESIEGFHDLMIHTYGSKHRYAVVHVEVDERLSLIDAHDIIHSIEEDVFDATGIILDVHLDPMDIQSPEIKEAVRIIKYSLKELNPNLSFHDVRFQDGKLLFDIVKDQSIQYSNNQIYGIIVQRFKDRGLEYPIDVQFDALDLLKGK